MELCNENNKNDDDFDDVSLRTSGHLSVDHYQVE
jgi:hypothetical protein